MDKKSLRKANLRKLKEELELSWSDISLAVDTDHNYLSDIAREKSTRGVSNSLVESLEKHYKLGRGWFDQEHINLENTINEVHNVYHLKSEHKNSLDIPIFDVHYAMGSGKTNFEPHVIVSNLSVTRKFIRENISVQTTPDNLSIVTGLGDSMQPTFSDQDQLFMDTGVKNADVDAIYGFDYLDDFYIKRLQRIPGNGLLAISDNKNYKPFEIEKPKDFFIHGQIVGIWNFKRV